MKKMQFDRTKNSIQGVIWGFIKNVVGLFLPFIVRTALVYSLGTKYLGLNGLFSTILNLLSVVELGIGGSITYHLYKPIAENDYASVKGLLNFFRKCYMIIAGIILIMGIMITPFLQYLVGEASEVPADLNIYILYFIYLFNTVCVYGLFAYKSALLQAYQKINICNMVGTITTFILYTTQILVLIFWPRYYVYVVLIPITTIINNTVISLVCDRLFPEYKDISVGKIKENQKKTIMSNVKNMIGHKVSTSIVFSTDTLFISSIFGLTTLGVYSNYSMIQNSINLFIAVFFNSILAGVGNTIVVKSKKEIYQDFKFVFFLNAWVAGWTSICLLCLMQNFIICWIGETFCFDFPIVVSLVLSFYFMNMRRVVTTYKDGAGMWREDRIKPYIEMIVNFALDVILVKYWGIIGLSAATIISQLFVATPWESNVVFKKLFLLSPLKFWFDYIKLGAINVAAFLATYVLTILIHGNTVLTLFLRAAICLVVPNVIIIMFYFKTDYWERVKNIIKNLRK